MIRETVFIGTLLFIQPAFSEYSLYVDRLSSVIPESWHVEKTMEEQVPRPFYNRSPKGELYVFTGPKTIYWNTKNEGGEWERHELGQESLKVWIMPSDYSPGWKTYAKIGRQELPKKIFSSEDIIIYAKESIYVNEENILKVELLLRKSATVYWDKIENITWCCWETDIKSMGSKSMGSD